MVDNVKEKIGSETPSEILEAAEQSDDYTEVPTGDDYHEVYMGEDLLIIGIAGCNKGVYTEEIPPEPDSHFDPIIQKPWEGTRKVAYSVEGNPPEVKQEIYGELADKDYLLDPQSGEGVETWIDSNDPDVRIELRGDKIVMEEEGAAEVPALENIKGIDIEHVWNEARGKEDFS